jgi:hypothetical protein
LVGGCGGGAGKIKGDPTALRVAERLEGFLNALKEKLASSDYDRRGDLAISQSSLLIKTKLPVMISERVTDEAVKQQALAKCKELEELYKKVVLEPVDGKPQDLSKAIDGVDQCLPLVDEIKGMLGG